MRIEIDVSKFHLVNVTDACAVSNVLSSLRLFSVAIEANCKFACTYYVKYECLHKARRQLRDADEKLKERMRRAIAAGQISVHNIDLEDLQELEILRRRKNLSRGELSSIAFAMKIRQALLTDDQGARRLAAQVMTRHLVQTTPQLLGWLYFTGRLSDGDKLHIITDHASHERPLAPYFEAIYLEAMRCRLAAASQPAG